MEAACASLAIFFAYSFYYIHWFMILEFPKFSPVVRYFSVFPYSTEAVSVIIFVYQEAQQQDCWGSRWIKLCHPGHIMIICKVNITATINGNASTQTIQLHV